MSIETGRAFDDSALFEAIDGAVLDPYVASVIEKMRIYNEMLASEPQTETDVIAIMNEVDEEWKALFNQTVRFSGVGWFPEARNVEFDDTRVRSYYDEEQMTFYGASPEAVGATKDEKRKYYQLRVFLGQEALKLDGERIELHGAIRLDDIAQLEFESVMSAQRARNILELHVPEILSDIDVALLNEAAHEGESIRCLADIVVDDEVTTGYDAESTALLVKALNVYVNSLMDYDDEAPYVVDLEGDIWLVRQEDDVVAAHIEKSSELAKIIKIAWGHMPDTDSHAIHPFIDFSLLSSDKDKPATRILAPISIVSQLAPVRYDFYATKND